MPKQWPPELYDYEGQCVVHSDIKSLDLETGLWFECKHCRNPKDPNGKYYRRSGNPFSPALILGVRGHVESKSHLEKSKPSGQKNPSKSQSLRTMFQVQPGASADSSTNVVEHQDLYVLGV